MVLARTGREFGETCGGDCCRCFTLSVSWGELVADAEALIDSEKPSHFEQGPYAVALFRKLGEFKVHPIKGDVYDHPVELFACAALGDDGLCTIYEHRPILCHKYPGDHVCRYPGCKCDAHKMTPLEMQC